jgi:hypothetical protein
MGEFRDVRLPPSQHQIAPAKIGDKLTTRNFGTGTRGFPLPETAG